MWLFRNIDTYILRLVKSFPAVLITGPRQIGKSSLLKHLFPKARYLSFDDPALVTQATTLPDLFLSEYSGQVILDEVQYVPEFFRHLKRTIDANPEKGRFLLTGSQTFPLMESATESLAGRCGIAQMQSLSLGELNITVPDVTPFQFIVKGGYPALYAQEWPEWRDWYTSYWATYMERDVRQLKAVGNLRDFDRLMRALAIRVGQLISFSDLARDVGITSPTVKSWISILEANGQVIVLEPYHASLGKRLVKSPKIYFSDTGLLCYALGVHNEKDLLDSPISGSIWENHVLVELIRTFYNRGERPSFWFWRTHKGEEVDILIERAGRFTAIECKLNQNPLVRDTRGIEALVNFYGSEKVSASYVACPTNHTHPLKTDPRVLAINPQQLVKQILE